MKKIVILSAIASLAFAWSAYGQAVADRNARQLVLAGNSGTDLSNTLTIKAPALGGGGYTLTFPATNGSPGEVLTSIVGGGLGWTSIAAQAWELTGNASTTPGTNFIGTTDNQAFEIHVFETDAADKGSKRVMRFEAKAVSPNIIGGYQGNSVSGGGDGNVIAGGGGNTLPNLIPGGSNNFIGGGLGNSISGISSVIAGGISNTVLGNNSAIPGGTGLTLGGSGSLGFLGANGGGANNMSVAAANTTVLGNTDLWLANNDNSPRQLRFYEAYNTAGAFPNTANYIAFAAPAALTGAGDNIYTLPTDYPASNGQVLSSTTAGVMSWATPATGTVTAVSVATANGFAGSSSGGATPALTLSTTVTGLVKGNGTSISAATAGTDYTLLSGGTTNTIPIWTSASAIGNSSITDNATNVSTSENLVLTGAQKTLTFTGDAAGVTTFKAGANGATSFNFTLPNTAPAANQVLAVSAASAPNYTLSWATPATGTVTAVSVATANGFAGSSSGGATPALTLSTTVTGLVKGNGTSISAATAGTDYSAGTSALATGLLKSTTGTGALSIAVASDITSLLGTTTYIQNQTAQQPSSNFNISGTGVSPVFSGGNGATGGALTVQGGDGTTTTGGAATFRGGNSTSGQGGSATLSAGTTAGTAAGGNVSVVATNASTTGAGGSIAATAGNGAGTDQNGGTITLTPGDNTGAGVDGYAAVANGKQLRLYESTGSGTNFNSFHTAPQATDINYILPTTQPTVGQPLTATAVVGSGPYTVTLGWSTSVDKMVVLDQSVTNSAVLVFADSLRFPLQGNTDYTVEGVLYFVTVNDGAEIKLGFDYDGTTQTQGLKLLANAGGDVVTSNVFTNTAVTNIYNIKQAVDEMIAIHGFVRTQGAGTFSVEFANGAAGSGRVTTLKTGSYLIVTKIR
jgi:hypothetical protein